MTRPQVLQLGDIDQALQELADLNSIAQVIQSTSQNRQEFLRECRSGSLDRVVVIYRSWESADVTGPFDEELVACLPSSVKFICHNGAGYESVNVAACTKKGIQVSHVPTAVGDCTADTTMFLILGALRGLNQSMVSLRSGEWRGQTPLPLGHDPQGKVLGILGMGAIGRNLKTKAAAFGMVVQYHNRNKLSEELSGGAKYVGFDELLATSDVLSVNVPLNKATHHLISHAEFAKMKKGLVLVNTARGAIINEAALVAALSTQQISSCGLDVYEEEPKIHQDLLSNPRVMLLPHMGTWTVEALYKMQSWNLKNVRSALEKGRLISRVVEQNGMEF